MTAPPEKLVIGQYKMNALQIAAKKHQSSLASQLRLASATTEGMIARLTYNKRSEDCPTEASCNEEIGYRRRKAKTDLI
jgi:hypothetical protein